MNTVIGYSVPHWEGRTYSPVLGGLRAEALRCQSLTGVAPPEESGVAGVTSPFRGDPSPVAD